MAFVPDWRKELQQFCIENNPMPEGSIVANLELQQENNSYGVKPYYTDQPFTCQDCGKHEIWTAKQQQWWYEIAKGNINSKAIRCRTCRHRVRDENAQQKKLLQEATRKKAK